MKKICRTITAIVTVLTIGSTLAGCIVVPGPYHGHGGYYRGGGGGGGDWGRHR